LTLERRQGRGEDERYVFGIPELDEAYAEALEPGTTLLIAGHPGAGKTTFAATICYSNALRGKPCLYVSFNERYDKFVSQMSKFGLDFERLKEEGLFKFIRVPVIAGEDVIDVLGDTVINNAMKINAKIVVIDSTTPISRAVREYGKGRSVLQNFFYDLSILIRGLVIMIEELPLGMKALPITDVEFVADAVILMRHEVKESLLVRLMEFRKFRGARLTIAEVPFTIMEGRGIKVFMPPVLNKVPPPKKDREYKVPCRLLEKIVGPIYPGMTILLATPPHARSLGHVLIPLMALAIRYKLKVGVVSYRISSEEVLETARSLARSIGIDPKVVKKYVEFIEAVNPTAYSLGELVNIEMDLIDRYRPDIIVFLAPELIPSSPTDKTYLRMLYNQLLYARSKGIIVMRIVSPLSEESFAAQADLADIVVKLEYTRDKDTGELKQQVFISTQDRPPRLVDEEAMNRCIEEIRQEIVKYI